MGWFSNVWDTVKSIGSTVAKVVKKVYEVCTSDSAVTAYEKLEKVIADNKQYPYPQPQTDAEPDFFGQVVRTDIEQKLAVQSRQLVEHGTEIQNSKRIMSLQIELTRLRSSAELIDRSMKNVKIHASSLSIHYQNMRNINGLIDDVNDLRHGLKAVIGTMNHMINLQNTNNEGGKTRKIEGIDIGKKDGAISQVAAYDAFDRTRELLRQEVIELSQLSSKHLRDIDKLKANAAELGGELGGTIISFLDREIIPVIKKSESAGLLLKSEVSQLPAAAREENGMLVFENGNIKLEQVD